MESRFEEEQTQLRYKIVSLERTIEAQRQQLGNLHSLTSSVGWQSRTFLICLKSPFLSAILIIIK